MVRRISAQVALLAFAVTTVAGLQAGNDAMTILTRALGSMCMMLVVGQVVASAFKALLRDHLQRKKSKVDTSHIEAVQAILKAEQEAAEQKAQAPLPTAAPAGAEAPAEVIIDEALTAEAQAAGALSS